MCLIIFIQVFNDLYKNMDLLQSKLDILNIQSFIPLNNHLGIPSNNGCELLYFEKKISINNDSVQIFDILNSQIKKNNNVHSKNIFVKYAPLINPCQYLQGDYENDALHMTLPSIHSSCPKLLKKENDAQYKMHSVNNSSSVDSFFLQLTDSLVNKGFIHGLSFYGSYLCIKNNFITNIESDIDDLLDNKFFLKHLRGEEKLFELLNFTEIIGNAPINILNTVSNDNLQFDTLPLFNNINENYKTITTTNINELNESNNLIKSSKSTDSYSSKTDSDANSDTDSSDCDSSSYKGNNDEDEDDDDDDEGGEDDENDENDENDEEEEDEVHIKINKFPVQLILMETCEQTFGDYVENSINNNNPISVDEWSSALMQIIMILLLYQKKYNFTHNDLHASNIMMVSTTIKYVVYIYNNITYKVPTFGNIYKIIDFGRSIYTVNGKLCISDEYAKGGDAYGQYNMEPFFNNKKPELLPNMSFDLTRLACALHSELLPDYPILSKKEKKNPIVKLINEWCLNDEGENILYHSDGRERHFGFNIHKIITKTVHNHTPENQLNNPLFKQYKIKNNIITSSNHIYHVMNLDRLINI